MAITSWSRTDTRPVLVRIDARTKFSVRRAHRGQIMWDQRPIRARKCGVIPQISVIKGMCAGTDVYSLAMTDFIFMVKDKTYMYVIGPDVVKTITNQIVTHEDLGGARAHTSKSGVADGAFENDIEALTQICRLVSYLPLSSRVKPPTRPTFDDPERADPSLDTLAPANPNTSYDMR